MRCMSAVLLTCGLALAACADVPSAPVVSRSFDVAPGSEISNVTPPLQAFSSFAAFVAATGSDLRFDPNQFPCTDYRYGWCWGHPFQLNGLKVGYYPYDQWGYGVPFEHKTTLLPAREFTFNGPDNWSIETEDLVYAVGVWIVDNTRADISGQGWGLDSRWTVRLYDADGSQVGSLIVDPPANAAFFLGIQSPILFKKAVFSEYVFGRYDRDGENDYWGSIYTTPRNVAPTIQLSDASILLGEAYSAQASLTDPDGISWTGTAAFGDGQSANLVFVDHSFTLEHSYVSAGDYQLVVTVTDERAGTGTASAIVHVLTPAQGADVLAETIAQIVQDGALAPADAKVLTESLTSALVALNSGNAPAALGKLGAFDNKVNALANSRRISADTQKQLLDYSARLQQSVHKK